MLRYQLLCLQQLRMINRPGGDLWAITATLSVLVRVAQLVVVTSVCAGGDLRVAAVTASPFWWRNSETKGSIMEGISLAYHVKFYRIYYILKTTALNCYVCIDVSFHVALSIAVLMKKGKLRLIGTEAGRYDLGAGLPKCLELIR